MSLAAIGLALQVGGSIFKGYSGYTEALNKRDQVLFDGRMAQAESRRTASMIEEEGKTFAEKQSLQYIASGVELGGSALITLAQTKSYAKAEANAVRVRGDNENARAGIEAKNLKKQATASLISGFLGAGSSIAKGMGDDGADNTVSTK